MALVQCGDVEAEFVGNVLVNGFAFVAFELDDRIADVVRKVARDKKVRVGVLGNRLILYVEVEPI